MNKPIQIDYPKGSGSLFFDGKTHKVIPDSLYGLTINNKNIYLLDYIDDSAGMNMSTILIDNNGIYSVPLTVYGEAFNEFRNGMLKDGTKLDPSILPDHINSIAPVELIDFLSKNYMPQNNQSNVLQDFVVDIYYRGDMQRYYADPSCTIEIYYNNANSLFYYDPGLTMPVAGNLNINSLQSPTRILYNVVSSNLLLDNNEPQRNFNL